MRRFVRIVLICCLSIGAVAGVLIGSLWAWISYKSAQVEAQYREIPLLNRMHDREKQSSNDSEAARQVLLNTIPLGSDREAVIAVLRKQGRFSCQTRAETEAGAGQRARLLESRGQSTQPQDHPAAKDLIECTSGVPSIVAYTTWMVRLEFSDGRLSDARVAVWHIFL